MKLLYFQKHWIGRLPSVRLSLYEEKWRSSSDLKPNQSAYKDLLDAFTASRLTFNARLSCSASVFSERIERGPSKPFPKPSLEGSTSTRRIRNGGRIAIRISVQDCVKPIFLHIFIQFKYSLSIYTYNRHAIKCPFLGVLNDQIFVDSASCSATVRAWAIFVS